MSTTTPHRVPRTICYLMTAGALSLFSLLGYMWVVGAFSDENWSGVLLDALISAVSTIAGLAGAVALFMYEQRRQAKAAAEELAQRKASETAELKRLKDAEARELQRQKDAEARELQRQAAAEAKEVQRREEELRQLHTSRYLNALWGCQRFCVSA